MIETIIEPGRIDSSYWRDMWRYRELFQMLAWRDIAVRYKQTLIGVLWAILRPLATMAVLTVVFGRFAGLPTEGDAPYALMVFAAMLPWTFFATALSDTSTSVVYNANLIGKVYFPRMIIPGAAVVVALIDFLVSLVLLAGLMAWYQFAPSPRLLLLPGLVLVAILAALGPGLWITAMNVKYRDFRFVVPFIAQLGLYISPVGFSSAVVPEKYRLLYSINPMVGVIDGFRWCILGGASQIYWPGAALSAGGVAFCLWMGISRFRKVERSFADLL